MQKNKSRQSGTVNWQDVNLMRVVVIPLSNYLCIYVFNNSVSYQYNKYESLITDSTNISLFQSIIMKGWIVKVKRANVLFWWQAACKQGDNSWQTGLTLNGFSLCLIFMQKHVTMFWSKSNLRSMYDVFALVCILWYELGLSQNQKWHSHTFSLYRNTRIFACLLAYHLFLISFSLCTRFSLSYLRLQ